MARVSTARSPHKQAVIPLLDGLAETARIAHAVNCVVRTDTSVMRIALDGALALA